MVSAMAGVTNQLVAWVTRGRRTAARRARVRRRGRHRRAGDRRAARDRAAVDGRPGALLAGLADPDHHRRPRTARPASPAIAGRRDQAPHRWSGEVAVVAGFQGIEPGSNRISTLGRGGSDTSAVAMAVGARGRSLRHLHRRRRRLHHRPAHRAEGPAARRRSPTKRCWRWPRTAPRCCRPARSSSPWSTRMRVRVLSSFVAPDAMEPVRLDGLEDIGTIVCDEDEIVEQQVVSGIAYARTRPR